jgi:hypothetical protein
VERWPMVPPNKLVNMGSYKRKINTIVPIRTPLLTVSIFSKIPVNTNISINAIIPSIKTALTRSEMLGYIVSSILSSRFMNYKSTTLCN